MFKVLMCTIIINNSSSSKNNNNIYQPHIYVASLSHIMWAQHV